jgi:hypothetical protein
MPKGCDVGRLIRLGIAVLLLSGCDNAGNQAEGAPTSAPASTAAPTTAGPTGRTKEDACPVTVETLRDALTSSADERWRNMVTDRYTLQDPICYRGYVSLRLEPKPTTPTDGAWILFEFDETRQGWVPVNVGSASYCEGHAPPEIANHFPGCGLTKA